MWTGLSSATPSSQNAWTQLSQILFACPPTRADTIQHSDQTRHRNPSEGGRVPSDYIPSYRRQCCQLCGPHLRQQLLSESDHIRHCTHVRSEVFLREPAQCKGTAQSKCSMWGVKCFYGNQPSARGRPSPSAPCGESSVSTGTSPVQVLTILGTSLLQPYDVISNNQVDMVIHLGKGIFPWSQPCLQSTGKDSGAPKSFVRNTSTPII